MTFNVDKTQFYLKYFLQETSSVAKIPVMLKKRYNSNNNCYKQV